MTRCSCYELSSVSPNNTVRGWMGEGAPVRGRVIVEEHATANDISTAKVESCSERNLNTELLVILGWDISCVTVDGVEWIFWIVELF